MSTSNAAIPTTISSDIEIVQIFMQEIDVVTSVRTLDSVDDYLELLNLFYLDGEKKIALLPELIRNQNYERYSIEVHGLKSAAANIGADLLSIQARQHEDAGKSTNGAWIAEHTAALSDSYELVLSEIRRVLTARKYGNFAPQDPSKLPAIDAEALTIRLTRAIQCLEDFESHQASCEVEELLGFAIPDDLRTGLEQALSLLKVYDDEQAESVLQELIKVPA